MKYSEMFSDSAQLWPTGGARLSPAACGFILAELEGLCRKYEKELESEEMHNHLRGMIEAHLEGLRAITESVEVGMQHKPEAVK